MAEIHDIKKTRKKRRQKVRNRRLLAILIVCGAILIIFGIVSFFRAVPIFNMAKTNLSAMQDTTGFPISIAGDKQYGLFFAKNYLAVKSDIYLFLYDKNGKFVSENQIGMENASYVTEGDKILYYTEGGKNLYVQSIYGNKTTMTTEDSIVTADVSKNGSVAVVVLNKHHLPRVEIYDRYGSKQPFTLHVDSNSRIGSISLSSDGKSIVVNGFYVEGGRIISKLSQYDIDSEEPKNQVEITGSLIYSAEKHGGGYILVCDNQLVFLDEQWKKISTFDYSGRLLMDFDNTSSNDVVIGLSEYGANASSSIYTFSPDGTELCKIDKSTSEQKIMVAESKIYILSQNTIDWYKIDGTPLGTLEIEVDSSDFLVSQNQAFILSANLLQKVSLVDNLK